VRYAQDQLRAFRTLGGDVLFGTDVGYMTDYDPTEEYRYMAGAGMTFRDILTALTTAPAARFGRGALSGVLAVGAPADVTALAGDPSHDVTALARVRYAIGGGKLIFEGKP
jgi:imidazolonepropionase-like amidohydrolase